MRAAAWFVVSEGVTNAAKHSGARGVTITLRTAGDLLHVEVRDNGRGGSDPSGGGLAGLARRVAAAAGTFHVECPPEGGTRITAELPCA